MVPRRKPKNRKNTRKNTFKPQPKSANQLSNLTPEQLSNLTPESQDILNILTLAGFSARLKPQELEGEEVKFIINGEEFPLELSRELIAMLGLHLGVDINILSAYLEDINDTRMAEEMLNDSKIMGEILKDPGKMSIDMGLEEGPSIDDAIAEEALDMEEIILENTDKERPRNGKTLQEIAMDTGIEEIILEDAEQKKLKDNKLLDKPQVLARSLLDSSIQESFRDDKETGERIAKNEKEPLEVPIYMDSDETTPSSLKMEGFKATAVFSSKKLK